VDIAIKVDRAEAVNQETVIKEEDANQAIAI
jgi:hypothetical protein